MSYQIIKMEQGKRHEVVARDQPTLKTCHRLLASIRHDYRNGLPADKKNQCKWYGRDSIDVLCITGKKIRYSIFTA